MRLLSIISVVITTFVLTPVFASANNGAEKKYMGTPVTSDNIVDVMEIQRVVTNLTDAADNARWDEVREILADKVDTTIGETEPGVSSVKTSKQITTRWAGFFNNTERFVMHHVTSNERVFFESPDYASVFSKGVIIVENTPAGAFAKEGGTLRGYRWVSYEFGVNRTEEGWKVDKVLVTYHVQEWDSLKASK